MHGRGIDRCRNVLELQAEYSRRQRELADVTDQRDVRIVNGDGQVGLIIERGAGLACAAGRSRLRRPLRAARGMTPDNLRNACQHGAQKKSAADSHLWTLTERFEKVDAHRGLLKFEILSSA